MSYYIRVLSTSQQCISITQLQNVLSKEQGKRAVIKCEDKDSEWTTITLSHGNGDVIAVIERSLVSLDSLAELEINEFRKDIRDCKPISAVVWLKDYFNAVKTVYAFQLQDGTNNNNGWEILGTIKNAIWAHSPSILQADNEGFSNEDGYHILWQFGESVKGLWAMGILQDNNWVHFKMNLGNKNHREYFRDGKIPPGIVCD